MTKNTISVTEYLNGAIDCLYLPKRDYRGQQESFDLTKENGRGQYFHALIARHFDKSLYPNLKQENKEIKNDAGKAIKWVEQTIPCWWFKCEERLEMKIPKTDFVLTGEPDLYTVYNDTLYVIDFKYSDKYKASYKKQVNVYSGMILELNGGMRVNKVVTLIKLKNERLFCDEYTKADITEMFINFKRELKEYIEEVGYTPCNRCNGCARKDCLHGAKKAIEEQFKRAQEWTGDTLTSEYKKDISFSQSVLSRVDTKEVAYEKTELTYDYHNTLLVQLAKERNATQYITTKEHITSTDADEMREAGIITQEEYDSCLVEKKKNNPGMLFNWG